MLLVLLKYPFYYMIRSCFGKFFGMIHVLTRHLAPELDRFRFCPEFWSMLHFDMKLDIFGDVLTHGYNWAKMRNKRKMPHAKDGTERGQKGPRPAGLEPLGRPAWSPWAGRPSPFRGPIGLSFLQREVCVNPNLCFTKTTDHICL